jgi:hypothetical protein
MHMYPRKVVKEASPEEKSVANCPSSTSCKAKAAILTFVGTKESQILL